LGQRDSYEVVARNLEAFSRGNPRPHRIRADEILSGYSAADDITLVIVKRNAEASEVAAEAVADTRSADIL